MSVVILAIESSCDDTSAAVCEDGRILSNVVAGQAIHAQFGGVIPELASRAHMRTIVPVVEEALIKANRSISDLHAIAFTQSPGLIGSLLVGGQFAKSLSLARNIPLIAVQHMQAHVLANLIDEPRPNFPFLCLTVSGGHTQIVQCNSPSELKMLGQTIDDAAGEAFDKTAKMLGLPYPGGPMIDRLAKDGYSKAFRFPIPAIPGLDFSFSGLKTAVLYFLNNAGKSLSFKQGEQASPEERHLFIAANMSNICASVQYTIIEILMRKLVEASRQTGIRSVCLAGGVSANTGLRAAFQQYGKQHDWECFIPAFEYCTDNAAMIAITGYYKFLSNDFAEPTVASSARSEW
ncbi:MAG: tRNA (adenosine(37)-N6)-threonylcarbamoyltransferase complex transferase subunit TsaD [Ferruginibacter sp.]